MNDSRKADAAAIATLDALVEAIAECSTLDKATIRTVLFNDGFRSIVQSCHQVSASDIKDFATDEELIDASPLPLSIQQHFELIRASLPLDKEQELLFKKCLSILKRKKFPATVNK